MKAAELMLVLGFDDRIDAVNPAWKRILGCTERALVGRRWLDFVHPHDAHGLKATPATVSGGEPVRRSAIGGLHQSGGHVLIEWSAVPAGGSVSAVGRAAPIPG